ncbi:MAG: sialate O-acetylesterase, partial [Paludibacter sp.]
MKTKILILPAFLCFVLFSQAEIKLSNVLTDNMVLQRNSEVKIWGKANANQKLVVTTSWNKAKTNATADEKGNWVAKVTTTEAGGPYTLSVVSGKESVKLSNILLGEVWLCSGQSNMDMPIRGYNDQPIFGANDMLVDADNDNIRLFTMNYIARENPIDSVGSKYGKWKVASAESVSEFSATAYLYAKQLQQKLKVPVGVITSAWGGSPVEAWMSKETIAPFTDALKQSTDPKLAKQYRATFLYNGMISPLLNFKIKGTIWYQGEANVRNAYDYAALLAAMVKNWRADFAQGDFPFYFVEIAPYFYNDSKSTSSALLREAQLKAQSLIPNSGMASTIDVGEEKGIHPGEKLTVAKRLAYWAFSETYGVKGVNCKSPTYKSITVKDTVAVI